MKPSEMRIDDWYKQTRTGATVQLIDVLSDCVQLYDKEHDKDLVISLEMFQRWFEPTDAP